MLSVYKANRYPSIVVLNQIRLDSAPRPASKGYDLLVASPRRVPVRTVLDGHVACRRVGGRGCWGRRDA